MTPKEEANSGEVNPSSQKPWSLVILSKPGSLVIL
jgi:hypothetical protein